MSSPLQAPRALVVGSVNVDVHLRVPVAPAAGETVLASDVRRLPGGKGANQAAGLARLGAAVRLCGAVGADADGSWSVAQLASVGVDTSWLRTHPDVATGLAVVLVDDGGGNRIVVASGANESVTAPPSYDVDVVVVQLEIPLAVVAQTIAGARAAGCLVILNAAPALPQAMELLAEVDVLVVNEPELRSLAGGAEDVVTTAASLLAAGARTVVVTLGAAGAIVVTAGGGVVVSSHRVDVIDTTGAGDCFVAALAYRLGLDNGAGDAWGGDVVVDAARFACAAAALSVTAYGARGALPTVDEVSAVRLRATM